MSPINNNKYMQRDGYITRFDKCKKKYVWKPYTESIEIPKSRIVYNVMDSRYEIVKEINMRAKKRVKTRKRGKKANKNSYTGYIVNNQEGVSVVDTKEQVMSAVNNDFVARIDLCSEAIDQLNLLTGFKIKDGVYEITIKRMKIKVEIEESK